jgi:electron transfer flavoprotein alpha subunit
MTGHNGILVCTETVGNKLAGISAELLGAGVRLSADMGQPLSALVIGADPGEVAAQAISMGAEKVLTSTSAPFLDPTPEQYGALLNGLYLQARPSVILMAQGDMGRDIAPRLAAKIGATATLDCTGIAVDQATSELLLTKPVYGGNAVAVWASSHFPQIVTLRPGSVPAAPVDENRSGEVRPLESGLDTTTIRTRLLQATKDESGGLKLEDAKVIVAGGAGIGGEEGLKLIKELAGVLGAAVGVSRVPCDLGWVPISMEIGQTGHIVSPDLYIAVGISGAPQHIAGCIGSKVIVAINRDVEANIFKVSDFGVVGDYRQILPSFIERLKSLKDSK